MFSSNDQMALGLLHAARERGRRVPEDLAVVGFDDIPEAAYFAPPLTTVRMPLGELGAAAIDALLDQLEGSEAADVLVPTRPRVIARMSTAAAPGQ